MDTQFPLLLFAVFVVVALSLVLGRLGGGRSSSGPWPFYVRKILSDSEQVLYHRLVSALPDHIVLAQVQVSRVLGVKKGFRFHEWNNRINRLSYDFVICRADSTVVAAVELDDATHDRPSRARVDDRKNKASADAGLRLLRWKARALPSVEAIRTELLDSRRVAVTSTAGQAGA